MDTQQASHRVPKIQFRVLIIGRANAGKTSILQRVCETTDSPIIYRKRGWRSEEVTLDPSMDRGEHTIDDELLFSNHEGYIFHDSRGIESGGIDELHILQQFIRRKCGEPRLGNRLHAIWYCVPMDNQRPQLDLKFFKDICPDRNVPVIAVFTKFDQFRRNVQIYVEDFGSPDDNVFDVADKQFQEHYLCPLGEDVTYVRLEKMHMQNMRCDTLIETTAAALNDDVVGLMLLAVQRGNLQLSVKTALMRVHFLAGSEQIVRGCLIPFPYIWYYEAAEGFRRGEADDSRFREARYFDEERSFSFAFRSDPFVNQIMSLPTIQNFTPTSLGSYHLIFAVILILKHATFLRLSNMSPESALTHAEVDYREANIDSRVHQYLSAPSSEQSDEFHVGFIMATDVTCTHIGISGGGVVGLDKDDVPAKSCQSGDEGTKRPFQSATESSASKRAKLEEDGRWA